MSRSSKAMFETSAEVLGALIKTFRDYEQKKRSCLASETSACTDQVSCRTRRIRLRLRLRPPGPLIAKTHEAGLEARGPARR